MGSSMIRHYFKKWFLYSSDGKKILGVHKTLKDAQAQELAIKLSKLRREGRIPPR